MPPSLRSRKDLWIAALAATLSKGQQSGFSPEEIVLGTMTFADAKQRFSNRVADYVRYRPGYPSAMLDLLRAECGLSAEHTIADIGSGTGILSKLFLDNGNPVFGVEPNTQLRQAA